MLLLLCFLYGLMLINGQLTPYELVDPFIGTGGEGWGIGENWPGACRPFGMARVSPDTVWFNEFPIPWDHNGGYYYGDNMIRCISHTHLVGAGVADLGTIGVMPINHYPNGNDVYEYGFRSDFSHNNETASPGYYSVYLATPGIQVELTATEHTGFHRYTYTSGDKVVLFPIYHNLYADAFDSSCAYANISIDTENLEVSGMILDNGGLSARFGGYHSYFVAQFTNQFIGYGTWKIDAVIPNQSSGSGCDVGGYVVLNSTGSKIEFVVGLSSISIEQARINLQKEVGLNNFDAVLKETQNIWNGHFSRITVQGGTSEQLIKFWTSVYRSLAAPTIFSEAGGVYLGFDNKVHQTTEQHPNYYTDMSIWDVHRTEFPWIALFLPDVMSDIVQSLVDMYIQGGDLPRWPLCNGYTSCMIGTHTIVLITDAYLKGVPNIDTETAYKAMKQAATTNQQHAGRADLDDYLAIGYVPYDKDNHGACLTLAYAYDDWALSNFAKAIGNNADSTVFFNRSRNYKNVFHPTDKFFCPKTTNGTWNCPDTWINVFDDRYVEGDAWHYRFFVPHDAPGLIELFGTTDYFVDQLSEFFYMSKLDPLNVLPNPYYWAGNEEDLLSVYLFNYAGRYDLTQEYLRWILDNKYSIDPDGLPGNDDYATMSAWYIWGSLGLYPLSGSTTFFLGSPNFPEVVISRPEGPLTIIAHNASPQNIYVANVTVNGVPVNLKNAFVDNSQLKGTATLEFWMQGTPSK